jgi:hypothetical protein
VAVRVLTVASVGLCDRIHVSMKSGDVLIYSCRVQNSAVRKADFFIPHVKPKHLTPANQFAPLQSNALVCLYTHFSLPQEVVLSRTVLICQSWFNELSDNFDVVDLSDNFDVVDFTAETDEL